ncbi:hypothetical protein BKH46_08330 [Helicobacter sp. 12S02634-8]|uniref:hypothetical protein n=1 Tax=Helicobacter sp. 12S02634-8 TaxID=1476199 RepID=UPI000BA6BC6B|nr:hypothetical protein [Helicobacter sp. 12S02634-8]PAF46237.1 hypothetical protein BKH46_08330 [Helicobacter sp. 12S02634-8]
MINVNNLIQYAVEKIAKTSASKEAKKQNQAKEWLYTQLKNQVSRCLKTSSHFEDRVYQRFTQEQEEILAGAISRSIRQTKPLETSRGDHIACAQKFIDEMSGIVVVLERIGKYGATLITSYIQGKESLLSDEELYELKQKGIIC